MRLASLLAVAMLPASMLAQRAPRIELAGGVANPIGDGPAFDGSGFTTRLTVATRPLSRLGLRADLSYSAPQLTSEATVVGATSGADVTALTIGAEWRGAPMSASTVRPYASLGVGAATGYYSYAVSTDDGRATGIAASLGLGARRAIGRMTFGLEIGYAVYGPVKRTALMPITLAIGF